MAHHIQIHANRGRAPLFIGATDSKSKRNMARVSDVFGNSGLEAMQKNTEVAFSRQKGLHLLSRARIPPYTPVAHFGTKANKFRINQVPEGSASYLLDYGDGLYIGSPSETQLEQLAKLRSGLGEDSKTGPIQLSSDFPLAFLANEPYQEIEQGKLTYRLYHQNIALVVDERPGCSYNRYLISTRAIQQGEELLWFYDDDTHGEAFVREYAFLRPIRNPLYKVLDNPLTLIVYDPTPQLPESVYSINGKRKVDVHFRRRVDQDLADYYTFTSVPHCDMVHVQSMSTGVTLRYKLAQMRVS